MSEGVPAATESAIETADRDSIVIVPRRLGPIHRPKDTQRPDDELDEIIDEMFGETTDEQPGRFDLVLLLAGLALAAWSALTSAPMGVTIIAALLILLGAALPARSALRAFHRRRLVAERRREAARGYPMDASDPSVAALVAAYEQLRSIAARSDNDLAEPAIVAAHLALVEAAAMLEGQPPVGDADRRYVDARTNAITEVALGLSTAPGLRDHARPRDQDARVAARSAKVAVREDFEASTDLGAMGRLRRLEARFEREAVQEPEA